MMSNNELSALMIATCAGHAGVITAILAGVPYPQLLAEQKSENGFTALLLAIDAGQVEIINALLGGVRNPYALVEQTVVNRVTALTWAGSKGHAGVVTALLSGVRYPRQQITSSNGPVFRLMMDAALAGHAGVIKEILEFVDDTEALIFQMDWLGVNPFMRALASGNTEAALVLFDWAKNKAGLLLTKNRPSLAAPIETMRPEILQAIVKKFNVSNQ